MIEAVDGVSQARRSQILEYLDRFAFELLARQQPQIDRVRGAAARANGLSEQHVHVAGHPAGDRVDGVGHVDAAWGGYLTTLFRNPDGSLRPIEEVRRDYRHFPQPEVHAAFAALLTPQGKIMVDMIVARSSAATSRTPSP